MVHNKRNLSPVKNRIFAEFGHFVNCNRRSDVITKYLLGDIWKGVTNTAVRDEFKHCNAYARKECQDCWAKLYCSGGCAANSYHATGSITGVYEYGCELFKKRMECAIMIKVAENQELAAKGIEVPIELGSTCNACADGEACE